MLRQQAAHLRYQRVLAIEPHSVGGRVQGERPITANFGMRIAGKEFKKARPLQCSGAAFSDRRWRWIQQGHLSIVLRWDTVMSLDALRMELWCCLPRSSY